MSSSILSWFNWLTQKLVNPKAPEDTIVVQGISGRQHLRGSQTYQVVSWQYASSTHRAKHDMNPALIIQPQNKDDIKLALRYAKEKGIAVAVRTGGHQYSGASSTGGNNIQLDLEKTFQSIDDRKIIIAEDGKTLVRTSISWALGAFNEWLTTRGLFIPHGQCTEVHLGGHCQTGGYGQLGRSFGLFGDHIRVIEMIDHEGNDLEITRESNPDLFHAVLGGSPGNFGVITHLTLEVHRDRDHVGARGLKALYLYNKHTLKRLIDILVKMSDDPDFPPNYDLCVSVLSSSFKMFDLWSELDGQMRLEHPEVYGEDGMLGWPRTIIVYAQWVPLSKDDKCDMSFFTQFDQDKTFGWVEQKAMSKITGDWIFRNVREFDHPYVKRAYVTNATDLGTRGWSEWVTGRIDEIVEPDMNKCWLSCQLQAYGGKRSRFFQNRDNGTSYSWRDTTMVCVLDAFYEDESKERAENWQQVNDMQGLGPNGRFSSEDRRVLWGSWGDFSLHDVWDKYHESQVKYEKLRAVRKQMDPNGRFTPNTFAVKRAD